MSTKRVGVGGNSGDKITKLMEHINISAPSSRRGSDVGLVGSKGFYIAPHASDVGHPNNASTTTTVVTGTTVHSPNCCAVGGGKGGHRSSCQLQVPPTIISQERRGSTGNILWRKGSLASGAPLHNNHLNVANQSSHLRRGSTPGDVLLFPARRDSHSRKFSTDSIDLNAQDMALLTAAGKNGNPWKTSQRTIVEEEVRQKKYSFYKSILFVRHHYHITILICHETCVFSSP